MQTILHKFCVERGSKEAAEIDKIREQTQGAGAGNSHICVSGIGYKAHFGHKTETVTIDTSFLFNNQWNEAGDGGRRLFDYYEESTHARSFRLTRYGHWLEITPEMAAIRESVHVCGFCGKHYSHSGFCDSCLGSEYLCESDLYLLRLLPASQSFGAKRPKLIGQESAKLLPAYREAQGMGKAARQSAKLKGLRLKVSKIVTDAEAKAKADIAAATVEQDGKNWLLDHNYRDIGNVIYYQHSHTWDFGWRDKLSAADKSLLTDLLTEFPYEYDFKADI